MLFWPLIILKYVLIVESARKMDIKQFMKRKIISDSWSVENISDKILKTGSYGRNGTAFCERPFALHRQQPDKDKQNCNVAPRGKISVDTKGCTDFNLYPGS